MWCWRRLLRIPCRARRSTQSILKEISPGCWKDWCWSWNSSTLATWCEELTHLKIPWCCERWRAGGEGDDRGWDGWMASPTQWTWVWVNSGSWWWTGRPGVLWSMGSQRVRHDWVTELSWTELISQVLLCHTPLTLFVPHAKCTFFKMHFKALEHYLIILSTSKAHGFLFLSFSPLTASFPFWSCTLLNWYFLNDSFPWSIPTSHPLPVLDKIKVLIHFLY